MKNVKINKKSLLRAFLLTLITKDNIIQKKSSTLVERMSQKETYTKGHPKRQTKRNKKSKGEKL